MMTILWNIFALVLMIFAIYCIWITNKDYANGKEEAPLGGSFCLSFFLGIFFLYRFMPGAEFSFSGFLDVCLVSLIGSAILWTAAFVWHSFIK